jgi:hypothetical protein
MSCLSKVNAKLKAANRVERFVRGEGYYYITNVVVSSSLYVYRLIDDDFLMALEHVEDVLTEEDGKPFKFGDDNDRNF